MGTMHLSQNPPSAVSPCRSSLLPFHPAHPHCLLPLQQVTNSVAGLMESWTGPASPVNTTHHYLHKK